MSSNNLSIRMLINEKLVRGLTDDKRENEFDDRQIIQLIYEQVQVNSKIN